MADRDDLVRRRLLNRLEVYGTVFAQWADDVFREFVAFINVAADFADKAFLSFGLWFWFDIVLVVGVGHGLLVAHDAGFGDAADEHAVGSEVNVLLYFERHECVDIFIQEYKPVAGTVDFLTGKFICASARLETESFKNRERCFYGQTVDIQDTSLLDHMVRVVGFVDVDCHTVRVIGQLGNGIYDQSVVTFSIVGGHNIETISDAEKCGHILFICKSIVFGNIFFAEFVGHCLDLFAVFFFDSGPDVNVVL